LQEEAWASAKKGVTGPKNKTVIESGAEAAPPEKVFAKRG